MCDNTCDDTYTTKEGLGKMDQVVLTKRVIKTLADKDQDYTITGVHTELKMVFAEPSNHVGEGKGKWLKSDGTTRDGGKF
jgi:hypothetical protein